MWREGLLNGWGRMTIPEGEKFEGSWIEGRKDGVGFVVTASGDWFEGVWRNDQVSVLNAILICYQVCHEFRLSLGESINIIDYFWVTFYHI